MDVELPTPVDVPELADDEVAILTLTNGRKLVVAEVNRVGGVCDDCKADDFCDGLTWIAKFEIRKIALG